MNNEMTEFHGYGFQKMPQAKELEMAVLGALLIDFKAIYDIITLLKPEDFYETKHQVIYQAIVDMFGNNEKIDILTVTEKIKSRGKLKEIGGAYYISMLVNAIMSAANIEAHSRIVKQQSIRRQLILSSYEISNQAFNDTIDCFNALDNAANRLQGIYDQVDKGKNEDKNTIAHRVRERAFNPPKDGINGLRFFGIDDLDYKLGGLNAGELTIIAARPSMGKSTLANTGFIHVGITQNIPILYWSLEGSNDETFHRATCTISGIDGSKVIRGKLSEYELQQYDEATEKIVESNCFFEDRSGVTASDIRMTLTSKVRNHGLKCVILDHGGHIKYDGKDTKNNKIGDALKILVQTAKELNIPIVLLWQLSRSVETRGGNKKPNLSDLRDSGELEQDAHAVMFVYRGEYYGFLQDEDGEITKNRAEIIIAKNKNLGTGTVKVATDFKTFEFKNIPKSSQIASASVSGIDNNLPF